MVCHIAAQYPRPDGQVCGGCIAPSAGRPRAAYLGTPSANGCCFGVGQSVSGDARIVRMDHGGLTPALLAQIDDIFFEASGRTFPPGADRDAFRERWLGRYLRGGTDVVLLALGPTGAVAGYLV